MVVNSALPDLLPPDLKILLDYWNSLTNLDGQPPRLSSVNLMDLYKIAPRMFIADRVVEDDATLRFRWRYWGTATSQFVGADLTGKYLDQTHDEKATLAALECYEWSIKTGNPQHFSERVRLLGNQPTSWQYERLIVPVRGNAERESHVMGVYFSEDEDKIRQLKSHTNEPISYELE